jgi:hypothetical protein
MDSMRVARENSKRTIFTTICVVVWNCVFAVLALAIVLTLGSCNGGSGSSGGTSGGGPRTLYRTTTLNISVGGTAQAPAGALHFKPHVFLGTYGDVASVTVVVSGLDKFGVFRNPLATVNLTNSGSLWTGSIPDLPWDPL